MPEEDRERLSGIEGGSLRFTVELADVNGDQEVEAPARSRPISVADHPARQRAGRRHPAAPESEPDSGSGTWRHHGAGLRAAPARREAAEAFQEYADCLDDTKPDDAQARARCAELLR